MAEVRPLRLSRWSRYELHAINALCAFLPDLEALILPAVRESLAEFGCELTPRREPPSRASLPTSRASTWLALTAGSDTALWIEISTAIAVDIASAVAGVAGDRLGPVAPEQGLTPLQSALLIYAAVTVVQSLPPAWQPVVLEGMVAPQEGVDRWSSICYVCRTAARVGTLRLWTPLRSVPNRGPGQAERIASADDFPIVLSVIIAQRRFSVATLRCATPGDLLLAERGLRPSSATLVAEGGCGVSVSGYLSQEGFHIEEEMMADRHQTVQPVLDQLTATLEIAAGTVTLPLKEILGLLPGQVLSLDQRLDQPVAVRVSGRVVGHGELVDIDGILGVRLTDWRYDATSDAS